MSEAVSSIVGSIEEILRYVAPGFVAIACLSAALSPDQVSLVLQATQVDRGYVMLIAGALAGVILNAIHVALLEEALCLPVVWVFRCRGRGGDARGDSALQMMRNLEARRELRRSSRDERATKFQARHDQHGATLTFLYCASYPGLLVALVQVLFGDRVSELALISGVVLFASAVVCDFQYTRRDIWGADVFGRAAYYEP